MTILHNFHNICPCFSYPLLLPGPHCVQLSVLSISLIAMLRTTIILVLFSINIVPDYGP